jgi:hypothetical protein
MSPAVTLLSLIYFLLLWAACSPVSISLILIKGFIQGQALSQKTKDERVKSVVNGARFALQIAKIKRLFASLSEEDWFYKP